MTSLSICSDNNERFGSSMKHSFCRAFSACLLNDRPHVSLSPPGAVLRVRREDPHEGGELQADDDGVARAPAALRRAQGRPHQQRRRQARQLAQPQNGRVPGKGINPVGGQ